MSATTRKCTDTVPEFHAEAPQATVSEELAQGPYMAARAGFEPTTLRAKGFDSTNEPPRPTMNCAFSLVGPSLWNWLSLALRLIHRILSNSFYAYLKTFLFSRTTIWSAPEQSP